MCDRGRGGVLPLCKEIHSGCPSAASPNLESVSRIISIFEIHVIDENLGFHAQLTALDHRLRPVKSIAAHTFVNCHYRGVS